jgi:predicted RNase H-like HicB family nuclease
VELSVAVYTEDDGFRAEVRQLPGCVASALTLAELGNALEHAVSVWLDDPEATLLYLELTPGEITVSAIPGSLGCRSVRRRA